MDKDAQDAVDFVATANPLASVVAKVEQHKTVLIGAVVVVAGVFVAKNVLDRQNASEDDTLES